MFEVGASSVGGGARVAFDSRAIRFRSGWLVVSALSTAPVLVAPSPMAVAVVEGIVSMIICHSLTFVKTLVRDLSAASLIGHVRAVGCSTDKAALVSRATSRQFS